MIRDSVGSGRKTPETDGIHQKISRTSGPEYCFHISLVSGVFLKVLMNSAYFQSSESSTWVYLMVNKSSMRKETVMLFL